MVLKVMAEGKKSQILYPIIVSLWKQIADIGWRVKSASVKEKVH